MWYHLKEIKDKPKSEKRNVFPNSQFESENLEVKKERLALVPSTKTTRKQKQQDLHLKMQYLPVARLFLSNFIVKRVCFSQSSIFTKLLVTLLIQNDT